MCCDRPRSLLSHLSAFAGSLRGDLSSPRVWLKKSCTLKHIQTCRKHTHTQRPFHFPSEETCTVMAKLDKWPSLLKYWKYWQGFTYKLFYQIMHTSIKDKLMTFLEQTEILKTLLKFVEIMPHGLCPSLKLHQYFKGKLAFFKLVSSFCGFDVYFYCG